MSSRLTDGQPIATHTLFDGDFGRQELPQVNAAVFIVPIQHVGHDLGTSMKVRRPRQCGAVNGHAWERERVWGVSLRRAGLYVWATIGSSPAAACLDRHVRMRNESHVDSFTLD
jgi:hypothetical protein